METAPSDRQLIERYLQDGDEESLRLLFGRYTGQVYGFLVRFVNSPHDAEDLSQETFFRAWRHLKKADPERSFRTWLFSIARHAAVDLLRKRRNVAFSAFDDADGGNALLDTIEDDAGLLPDALLERKDAAEALKQALGRLPPAFREVVLLRYESELSFQEIGEVLGEPLNTVKSRYRRALFALRKLLEGDDPAPKPPS